MSQSTENIEAKLAAYVDGELDEAGRAEIEKHLVANPQHRKLMEELMQMRGWVRALPRESAPGELVDTLQGQMERSSLLGDPNDGSDIAIKLNRWPQYIALAAIFMLAVGLAVVVYVVISPGNAPSYTLNPPPRILTEEAAKETTQPTSAPTARKTAVYSANSALDEMASGAGKATESGDSKKAKDAGTPAPQSAVTVPADGLPSVAMVPPGQVERGVAENRDNDAMRSLSVRANDRADKVLEAQTQVQQLQKENRTNNPVVLLVQARDVEGTSRQVTDLLLANNLQWEPALAESDKDAFAGRSRQMRGVVGDANGGKGSGSTTLSSEATAMQSTTDEAPEQSSFADSTTAPAIENDTLAKSDVIGGLADQAKQGATTQQFASQPTEVREGDAIVVRNLSWQQANEIKWSMVTRQVGQKRAELKNADGALAMSEKREMQWRDQATTHPAATQSADMPLGETKAAMPSTTQASLDDLQAPIAKPRQEASLLDAEIIDITPAVPAPVTQPAATTGPATQESKLATERNNEALAMNAEDKVDLVIIFQSQLPIPNVASVPESPTTQPTEAITPDPLPATQPATQPAATTQPMP